MDRHARPIDKSDDQPHDAPDADRRPPSLRRSRPGALCLLWDGSVATNSPEGVRDPVRSARPSRLTARPRRSAPSPSNALETSSPAVADPPPSAARSPEWTSPSSVRPVPDFILARTEKIRARTTSRSTAGSTAPPGGGGGRPGAHQLTARAGSHTPAAPSAISTTRATSTSSGLLKHPIIICSAGSNINPEELEAVLESDPAVREAAVVALPDRRLAEHSRRPGGGRRRRGRHHQPGVRAPWPPTSVRVPVLRRRGTACALASGKVDKPAARAMEDELSTS